MNWVKHLSAVAIVGTLTGVACSSDDDSDDFDSGGSGNSGGQAGESSGGSSAGQNGSGASGGSVSQGGEPGTGGGTDIGNGGSPPDSGCQRYNELCETDDQCCSGTCNPDTNTCESNVGECRPAGEACEAATDCCTLRCEGGECSSDACVSDGDACEDNAECCGGQCADGACVALNPSCKTAGNDCDASGECCSKLCGDDGKCTLGASWCIQPGDACTRNEDCCSAECNVAEGATIGTCAIPPSGSTFCSGVEGVVCEGCGDCCSRLCAPFGPTGVSICQPVSGCHTTGELCRQDSDCCGGTLDETLPGWGNGQCQIEPGHAIGICRNPVNGEENPAGACSPQGNVCHYKDYECSISSARANCCDGLGAKGTCRLDPLGVPRCNGLGDDCRDEGETCASNADCCDFAPCVPDEEGVLRCGGGECVPKGDTCTINGDCCPGSICVRPPGATVGTCDGTPPPGGEGGAPGAGGGPGGGGTCSEYGQLCDVAGDCCNNVPCTDGVCRFDLG
jgi:hypothetical protein